MTKKNNFLSGNQGLKKTLNKSGILLKKIWCTNPGLGSVTCSTEVDWLEQLPLQQYAKIKLFKLFETDKREFDVSQNLSMITFCCIKFFLTTEIYGLVVIHL